jgi:hypothetical protein
MRSLALVLTVALGCIAASRPAVAWPRLPAQLIPSPPCEDCGVLAPPYRITVPFESPPAVPPETPPETPPESPPESSPDDPMQRLDAAIPEASPGPRRVLEAMREMLRDEVVVRGSCNRWVQEVFRRAGGRSRTVYSASRRAEFTDLARLQPGDWVHFINHSYEGVTHSAVFIGWTDASQRTAMTASYPGQNRDAPGRFRDYDLSNVYRIVRLDDALPSGRIVARR